MAMRYTVSDVLSWLVAAVPRVVSQAFTKYPTQDERNKEITTITLRRDLYESGGSSTIPEQNHAAAAQELPG